MFFFLTPNVLGGKYLFERILIPFFSWNPFSTVSMGQQLGKEEYELNKHTYFGTLLTHSAAVFCILTEKLISWYPVQYSSLCRAFTLVSLQSTIYMKPSVSTNKNVDRRERYGEKRCDTTLKQTEVPSPVEDNTQLDPSFLCINIHSPKIYLVICMEGKKKKKIN